MQLILTIFMIFSSFAETPKLELAQLSQSLEGVNINPINATLVEVPADKKIEKGFLKDFNGKNFEVSSISFGYAEDLLSWLGSQKEIPFNYPEEGAHSRAHKMVLLLEEKKIISAKAFIEGSLWMETKRSSKGYVRASFNVMPVVLVRTAKNEAKPYVLDPILFSKPVPFTQWLLAHTKNKKAQVDGYFFTKRFSYRRQDKNSDLSNYQFIHKMWMEENLEKLRTVQRTIAGERP